VPFDLPSPRFFLEKGLIFYERYGSPGSRLTSIAGGSDQWSPLRDHGGQSHQDWVI